ALRGFELTPNNRRQARVPGGAEVVQNPVGSAPMLVVRIGSCTCFVVAGVPGEYRPLVSDEVLPRIEALRIARGERARFAVRLLKTIGLPESQLDQRVARIAAAHPEVVFGFRTVPPENHLKLSARGPDLDTAERTLATVEAECVAALGTQLFGRDDATLPGVVLKLLEGRGETVALAESLTGGGIARELTSVPGASNSLPGAAVTYQTRLKTDWLGVPDATIQAEGVVSAEVARGMAEGIRSRAGSAWGLSTTGYAGPGGGDAREPVGAVYIGVAGPDGTTHERHVFTGDRERVRRFATFHALEALRRRLLAAEGRTT
ncbi:MAG: nicotinamide-nucleotide amidohydrolase family protein, partial [Myxococcaceae bacterium]